jgi:hypothetical protein
MTDINALIPRLSSGTKAEKPQVPNIIEVTICRTSNQYIDGPNFTYKEQGKVNQLKRGQIKSDAHETALIEKARENAKSRKAQFLVQVAKKATLPAFVEVNESY